MRQAKKLWAIGYGLLMLAGCTQQPQQVRHLHERQEPDSAMMAQLHFNMQMASEADKMCSAWIQNDTATYALDDFGFWYTQTINSSTSPLQIGEEATIHLQMAELNGQVLADIKEIITIGTSDLPVAINRSLKQLGRGEQMRIVAPWYTAYGTEGTTRIKPYTNLVITLTISNE